MIRKVFGVVLLMVGVLIGLILLTYGGPIWPHIIGPITLIVVGVILLALRRIAGFFRTQGHS